MKKDLENDGWHVIRASGSHGAYDLCAFKQVNLTHVYVKLIQCKVMKKESAAELRRLQAEFRRTSPITFGCPTGIEPALYVKITGTKGYQTYPLGVIIDA